MRNAFNAIGALIFSLSSAAWASAPQLINYQGILTDGSGSPLSGTYSVQFTIYDALNTTVLWQETQSVTTDASGLFNVLLGSITPLTEDRFEDETRFLGIKIGSDPELSPRTRLASVPYAMRAATVNGASGGLVTSPLRIGPLIPPENAAVSGSSFSASGGRFASTLASESSGGVVGEFTGSGSIDGVGVRGRSHPTNGFGIGGWFEGGYQGVKGEAVSPGIICEGVIGVAELASLNYGVVGRASSAAGQFGAGVYGTTGDTGGELWAGYFDGWVNVTGQLTKGSGAFKIDHPLDPEHKYLQHSFVESPDMKNIYDGVVTLDHAGEAVVTLPEWFGALNRDFRYQLTCIGGYAPVYIAEEIRERTFRIAGGEPGLKVSWQVTGIRQDAFANSNRIEVEVAKKADRVGTYIHPEAFGLTRERGEDFQREKRADALRARGID